jgi:N,N'-diacetyllegionaminate synthase
MSTRSTFLYAETAFHHEGDPAYLRRLVEAAAASGAQGIKFQLLARADGLLSPRHPDYARLAPMVLPLAEWDQAFALAADRGLEVVAMPLDLESFVLVERHRKAIRYLDIHSVSFYDDEVMRALKATGIPIVLAMGGRTLAEVDEKVAYFGEQLRVLVTGFQAFPTAIRDVRLPRIAALRQRYAELLIGYADHSPFASEHAVLSNVYAYLLGARVFEKHLTVSEGVKRADFEAAVGPEKFADIARRLEELETEIVPELGDRLFAVEGPEETYRKRQRVAVATRLLPRGTVLAEGDVVFRMSGTAGGIARAAEVVGRRITRALEPFEVVQSADFE